MESEIIIVLNTSRKILSIGEFDNATTENAIEVLRGTEKQTEEFNAMIEAINTDRGAQFYPNKKDKNGEADSVFQNYLESQGIKHIPSRRNNPQTNGKIERFVQTYKKHRHRLHRKIRYQNYEAKTADKRIYIKILERPV